VPATPSSVLPVVLSTIILASIVWIFEPLEIAQTLLSFSTGSLASIGSLLLVGALLAAPRLQTIVRKLGYRLTFSDAVRAVAFGQIGGALSVQFFGQVVARSALLHSRGIQLPANIAITSLEKLVAFVVAFTMALGGAIWLFGGVAIQLDQGGLQFIHLVIGLLFAILGGALLGWGRIAWLEARNIGATDLVVPLSISVAYTVARQICTAAAYVIAAKSLAPFVSVLDLVAASFVIMFAASIPISFSGWGVRELSAVFALKTVGVPAGAAIAVAITIGALALFVVISLSAFTFFLRKQSDVAPLQQPDNAAAFDIATALSWLVPILVATLIVVQIRAPTSTGFLNFNPADPFALVGAALFWHAARRRGMPVWRVPKLLAHVASMTAAVMVAFLIGLQSFGLTDWAFLNRTLGWFVLLAYASTGALAFQVGGATGVSIALRTFVGAVMGAIAFNLLTFVGFQTGWRLPAQLILMPFEGLTGNRNAFAFLIVMAIACLPISGVYPYVLGFLGVGVWFTGSFAGLGAAFLVILAALVKRYFTPLMFAQSIAIGVAVIVVVGLIGPIASFVGFPVPKDSMSLSALTYSSYSFAERFKSLQGGLTLFVEHPLFGAGLGAYMNAQTQIGNPLVIHSTPLWLLAELGLTGFSVFVWFGWRVTRVTASSQNSESKALLLIVIGFCTMAAVHDMMYQRSIWLLAGALLAASETMRPGNSRL
jgi:hypothetical protein